MATKKKPAKKKPAPKAAPVLAAEQPTTVLLRRGDATYPAKHEEVEAFLNAGWERA